MNTGFLGPAVTTVLTVYGIETCIFATLFLSKKFCYNSTYRLRYWNRQCVYLIRLKVRSLQQYLPFTVLKPWQCAYRTYWYKSFCYNSTYRLRYWNGYKIRLWSCYLRLSLQQYLPFTVLKLNTLNIASETTLSYNSTYRLRYWNKFKEPTRSSMSLDGYNSTYRLRYWNWGHPPHHILFLASYNSTYRLRYWNSQ